MVRKALAHVLLVTAASSLGLGCERVRQVLDRITGLCSEDKKGLLICKSGKLVVESSCPTSCGTAVEALADSCERLSR